MLVGEGGADRPGKKGSFTGAVLDKRAVLIDGFKRDADAGGREFFHFGFDFFLTGADAVFVRLADGVGEERNAGCHGEQKE